METNDAVDHPTHYNKYSVEVITLIKEFLTPSQYLGFLIGNIIKYRMRAPHKGSETLDNKKADWYTKELQFMYPQVYDDIYEVFAEFVKEKHNFCVPGAKSKIVRYKIPEAHSLQFAETTAGSELIVVKKDGTKVVVEITT